MKNLNPNIKILVACHKEDQQIRKNHIYLPIQVGKELHPNINLGFQCDNTGDNISKKNDSYCELTALYWAWKNLKNIDYIGLAHYRRYLNFDILQIQNLKDNTIILPRPAYTPISNLFHLIEGTTREDVYIFLLYLKKYQTKYFTSAINYLYNYNGWIGCNMFISNKKFFDNYCSWLFETLFALESYLKPSQYSRLKRIFGYLGEIMLPIYCITNQTTIQFVDMDSKVTFKQKIHSIYNRILFRLNHRKKVRTLMVPDSTLVSLKVDNIIL